MFLSNTVCVENKYLKCWTRKPLNIVPSPAIGTIIAPINMLAFEGATPNCLSRYFDMNVEAPVMIRPVILNDDLKTSF